MPTKRYRIPNFLLSTWEIKLLTRHYKVSIVTCEYFDFALNTWGLGYTVRFSRHVGTFYLQTCAVQVIPTYQAFCGGSML